MRKTRVLTLSMGILALVAFMVIPAISAAAATMSPYADWAEANKGARFYGTLYSYKYSDGDIAVWMGYGYYPSYEIRCCVDTRISKTIVGTPHDPLRIHYKFYTWGYDPNWKLTLYQYWVYVYNFDTCDWGNPIDLGEHTGAIDKYYDIPASEWDDYVQSSGSYWHVHIKICIISRGDYFYIERQNAVWYWYN